MNENNSGEKLFTGVLRLNAKVLGLVLGILSGGLVFVMTMWLVVKGGPVNAEGVRIVGPHLRLLGQFFIGYTVSPVGSVIGFAYGFAVGTICGSFLGWVYNRIVDIRG